MVRCCVVLLVGLAAVSSCASRPDADLTAPTASVVAPSVQPSVECFCMSWVHRDDNGEDCFATRDACDEHFASFSRSDKIPCRPEVKARCERIACRGSGAECFRLP